MSLILLRRNIRKFLILRRSYGIARRCAPRPFGAAVGKASGVQIERTVDLSNLCGLTPAQVLIS